MLACVLRQLDPVLTRKALQVRHAVPAQPLLRRHVAQRHPLLTLLFLALHAVVAACGALAAAPPHSRLRCRLRQLQAAHRVLDTPRVSCLRPPHHHRVHLALPRGPRAEPHAARLRHARQVFLRHRGQRRGQPHSRVVALGQRVAELRAARRRHTVRRRPRRRRRTPRLRRRLRRLRRRPQPRRRRRRRRRPRRDAAPQQRRQAATGLVGHVGAAQLLVLHGGRPRGAGLLLQRGRRGVRREVVCVETPQLGARCAAGRRVELRGAAVRVHRRACARGGSRATVAEGGRRKERRGAEGGDSHKYPMKYRYCSFY
eukprot:Rhum_TRINITY_DN10435_c0_g2::Rhum_TRINITY_DN10435_c0_g2_i1::g.38272::m.38272